MLFTYLSVTLLSGQSFSILVFETDRSRHLPEVEVYLDGQNLGFTNSDGIIEIPLIQDKINYLFQFNKPGFFSFSTQISKVKPGQQLEIKLTKEIEDYAEIATVTLDEGEGSDNRDSEVYSLLAASRDPLLQAAAFQFGIFRFRNRGVDNQYNQLGFEGFLLNDLENGFLPFLIFSGQNQITRYSENKMSFQVTEEDFGSAGLNQWIQFDPRTYRKGLHANYSLSNRSFSHRVGLQYVGHWGQKGLSLVAGVNRRWAENGIYKGSFYDAYGTYLGLRKSIGKKSGLSFLGVFSPVIRGKNSPGVQEVYDLSGDDLYNSYWGFQSGEIRNSRVANTAYPTFFLNFDSKVSANLTVYSGAMFLKGKRSDSSIDWYDVADPRADYYQKLPSYIQVPSVRDSITKLWSTDENVCQVNWERLYQVNRSNQRTIHQINGTSDSLAGKRSLYILSDRYSNPTDFEYFFRIRYKIRKVLLNTGYRLEYTIKDNYLKVADLLGGDFFVDKENFINDPNLADPDISNKNKIVKVGDIYGYHYAAKTLRNSVFANLEYRIANWDFLTGIKLAQRSDSRVGYFSNAIFTNSEGVSKTQLGFQYQYKLAATYKLNGRNYVRGSFASESLAPNFEQQFINPAWRADVLPNIKNTLTTNADLSYYYRSPLLKIQIGVFYSKFNDQIKNRDFFLDEEIITDIDNTLSSGGLINGFYTGLDQEHRGIEFSAQYSLGWGFDFLVAGQFGRYLYTSRPDFFVFDQFSKNSSKQTIYLLNFFVPNTPQHVLTAGLKYNFKRNGFAQFNVSYADRNYVELNPLRRTVDFVRNVERNDPLFRQIIDQEKLPHYVVVDFNVFKSYKIKNKFISISLALNNLLNNTSMKSGGFEQNRLNTQELDISQFPNKYFNLQGFNFFLNINLSLNESN